MKAATKMWLLSLRFNVRLLQRANERHHGCAIRTFHDEQTGTRF